MARKRTIHGTTFAARNRTKQNKKISAQAHCLFPASSFYLSLSLHETSAINLRPNIYHLFGQKLVRPHCYRISVRLRAVSPHVARLRAVITNLYEFHVGIRIIGGTDDHRVHMCVSGAFF